MLFAKPHRGGIKCNVLDSAPVGLIRGGVLLHRALPCAIDYALSELFMIFYNLPGTAGFQPFKRRCAIKTKKRDENEDVR
jgi:hypothetical protein